MTTTQNRIAEATAFVAEAERMTNERDVDGIRAIVGDDVHQLAIFDGMVIEARGRDEIHQAWGRMCAFMDARRMFVSKSVVTADENTIVNEWTGEVAGRPGVRGIEVWKFDAAGLVSEHRLYGFLDPRPETSVVQSLRMLLAHPGTALGYAKARNRA